MADPPAPIPGKTLEESEFRLTAEIVLGLTDAQPRIYAFLLKRLGNSDQAQEVLQNVSLTICRKASDYRAGTDFMAWAFAIARFELMCFRQNQAREKLVFSDELVQKINDLDGSLNENHPFVDRKSALEKCLERLPPNHRHLITRRYAESVSVKAIAADLGRTSNAVSVLLHRIREKLMECIKRRLASELNG